MNLPTMHFKWVMRPMVKLFGKRRITTEMSWDQPSMQKLI